MNHVLCVNGVSKRYRKTKVLNNLTMQIPRGSIYGLVGKNGAGKTTIIRIICGLQNPTGGNYSLYGVDYTDEQIVKFRKRMGAIVETPSMYLDMTASDNLKQQSTILGLPSYDGIDELLKLVKLDHVGKKKAKHFSLGMKQRLAIAISLVGNPDFIVLDEPINGLDPQGVIEIRELILRLNREHQITVLISSHILSELSKLATHFGFIDDGRMVKELSAEELEQECRKCTRIEVTNIKTLVYVLDEKGIDYKIYSDTKADIYSKVQITELANLLYNKGCEILSISEKDEDLESYYMNLVGGGKHE